jgi:iron complex transport system ATP-binding protein
MPTPDRLRRNISRYQAFAALSITPIMLPVIVLFWRENGLDLFDIFLLQAIFAVANVLLEVPTGMVADRLGKRTSLATLLTVVPQRFAFNFDFTVYDTVMMGRYPHIPRLSSPTREDHQLVAESLTLLDIEHLAQRSIRKLSGGETQRAMIARALVQDTDFILLDEVTANLDINHAIAIMRTMKKLVEAGKTVIAALHDLNMALGFCDEVLVLNDGRLHRQGGASEVINNKLVSDIYQVSSEVIRNNEGNVHLCFKYQ